MPTEIIKTIYATLLVTAVILSGYLVVTIEKNIPLINANIADSQKAVAPLQEELKKQQEMLALIQAELQTFHQTSKDRIAKEEKKQAAIDSIKVALNKVIEADDLRKKGKLSKAAELIKSTKKEIWKLGDTFKPQQKIFRGLMQPIDKVSGKWKSGESSATAKAIIEKLKSIVESVD